MSVIPYAESLIEFNRRVLSQGNIPYDTKSLSPADVKQILFFNDVFKSNMIEMFQKFNMGPYVNKYVDLLNQYIRNLSGVICITSTFGTYTETIMDLGDFDARLAVEKDAFKQLLVSYYKHGIGMQNYEWDLNTIYFISESDDNIIVSHIDPKSAVYEHPFIVENDGKSAMFKTDYAIQESLNYKLHVNNTVAMRIITNTKTNRVALIEYHGSKEMMTRLSSFFGRDVIIISNPFIYTGDMKQLLSSKIPKEKITKPKFTPIDFSDIFVKDRLIEFPNDSFDEYLQFLRLACDDEVESIYVTLYRIGSDPSIFYILREASRRGINVHVNIELKASGEDINYFWHREMRDVGINVTHYACGTLKVHSKLTLIKFKNGNYLAQIGTGNYHTVTTSQYTDLCLITGDDDICHQVEDVFKIFTGDENVDFTKDFLVTRYNAKEELLNLIMEEGAKGSNGYIALKCNSLDDPDIIMCLEGAASRGCRIDAVVRGACTWIPREDQNVRIKSIIWDKLEHSRVYCFGMVNPKIYIGSLDLVKNKLDKRIETLVRIKDPDIIVKVCEYLNRYITNTDESWIQQSDGTYTKEV